MGIIDNFTDTQFIELVTTCTTWKELGQKLGYKKAISSNNKKKILDRCALLNINNFSIKKIEPVSSKTKGELFSCRKNWQSARTSIRKNAQKVFEQSEKSYKCAICGYDKHIEIAHIKAVSEFDDSALLTEINHPDNLIALCPNHHWEFDNNLLKLNTVGE